MDRAVLCNGFRSSLELSYIHMDSDRETPGWFVREAWRCHAEAPARRCCGGGLHRDLLDAPPTFLMCGHHYSLSVVFSGIKNFRTESSGGTS